MPQFNATIWFCTTAHPTGINSRRQMSGTSKVHKEKRIYMRLGYRKDQVNTHSLAISHRMRHSIQITVGVLLALVAMASSSPTGMERATVCPQYCILCKDGSSICACDVLTKTCPPPQPPKICPQLCKVCNDGTVWCACAALTHTCTY
ncbi:hypothetical protein BKA62DRAFT_105929 [Auriculariales sp. MPI-PUGE-AT-0066]|nr:hypothetical protein BKA62DRAFT_105929 [Auriculariales sp. MPI-PUGE-AT-0066]